ncbi:hypothetical protein RAC83_001195, partial [Xylella fastidiosa]|nr:hypothetical protein [Xylella fastidiosa]
RALLILRSEITPANALILNKLIQLNSYFVVDYLANDFSNLWCD